MYVRGRWTRDAMKFNASRRFTQERPAPIITTIPFFVAKHHNALIGIVGTHVRRHIFNKIFRRHCYAEKLNILPDEVTSLARSKNRILHGERLPIQCG